MKQIYENITIENDALIEETIQLACESAKNGGGPFAATLVLKDPTTKSIIKKWQASNSVTKDFDPTAHAEINVTRKACHDLSLFHLDEVQGGEMVLYSSCEPCPMCYAAISWAHIPTVIFAGTRFDAAEPGVNFSDQEIYDQLELPYDERKIIFKKAKSKKATAPFEVWKKIEKTPY